jgi:hypothetical protein
MDIPGQTLTLDTITALEIHTRMIGDGPAVGNLLQPVTAAPDVPSVPEIHRQPRLEVQSV